MEQKNKFQKISNKTKDSKLYFRFFNHKKLKYNTILNYSEKKYIYKSVGSILTNESERLAVVNFFQKFKSNLYFSLNFKKIRIFNEKVYNIFDTLQNLSNLLLYKKLVNLIMYQGKKTKAENLILKTFEILKSDYGILNPLSKLKFVVYKNLVPHILPKVIKVKKKTKPTKKNGEKKNKDKDEKKEDEKTIGVFKDIHYRVNLTLKLFIKGARQMVSTISYGLVAEFLNIIQKQGFLFKYNKQILKILKDYQLYFFKPFKRPYVNRKKLLVDFYRFIK